MIYSDKKENNQFDIENHLKVKSMSKRAIKKKMLVSKVAATSNKRKVIKKIKVFKSGNNLKFKKKVKVFKRPLKKH